MLSRPRNPREEQRVGSGFLKIKKKEETIAFRTKKHSQNGFASNSEKLCSVPVCLYPHSEIDRRFASRESPNSWENLMMDCQNETKEIVDQGVR